VEIPSVKMGKQYVSPSSNGIAEVEEGVSRLVIGIWYRPGKVHVSGILEFGMYCGNKSKVNENEI
jgi:hypothetical protein